MKKVLIITYYWPPASGPGVQRFLKTSKYLPELGWKPYILTVSDGSYPSTDESLISDIPKEATIYKSKALEPFKYYNRLLGKKGKSMSVGGIGMKENRGLLNRLSFYIRANWFVPDARKGWIPFAYKKAKKIVEKENIQAIITTGPPHSTHLTGLKLKEKYKLPWVADMRDPWTNVYYNALFPRTERTKINDKNLEDSVLKSADLVTTVSKGLADEFDDRARNTEIIYNGYDEIDMISKDSVKTDIFTISYTGNFKPNQNAEQLWLAISELCNEIDGFTSNLEILLTGNVDPLIIKDIKNYKLSSVTKIQKFVPHKEATKIMVDSNLLIFIIPQAINNHLIITGKLFEYIASGTEILSIGPVEGDASNILKECNQPPMSDYNDKEGIKQKILSNYQDWIKNNQISIKKHNDQVRKFSRKSLTEKLVNRLNQLVNENE